MNVLAIDTTLGACSAAIYVSREGYPPKIQQIRELMNRGHAEKLIPMIRQVTKDAGLKFSDIDRIAVTTGPGTFTGVRIGVATARGLALGIGCKIYPATSLRVLARKALKELKNSIAGHNITVSTDARRGEIYLQSFNAEGDPLNDAVAMTPENAITKINTIGRASIIVGNAMDILTGAGLGDPHIIKPEMKNIEPGALELAELAASATKGTENQFEYQLEDHTSPLYLRAPDAKPQIGKSVSRTGQ